jgi:hypothetical protein
MIARSAAPIRRPRCISFHAIAAVTTPTSYGGILQADAHAGFNALYKDGRGLGPLTEVAFWAHARR